MGKKSLILLLTALFCANAAFAQSITVRGTITDANTGEPIPFATVMQQNTRNGQSSDVDGIYSISVPSDAILVFSSIGYKDQIVPVGGRALHDVALEPDSEVLDETIVVAYGTATKSSFTGSAAVVKEETIEKKLTTNVTSALAGTTPGVQVISSSGDPTGNASTIRIRGIGSMSASSSPLIVVDGVPFGGSISDINPQDVESMSVLKDASASAIYGHRGANGVVLITTKKGKSGDALVKFDARVGVNSRLIPQYDVIDDPGQYYETFFTQLYNQYFYSGHSVAESYAYANRYLFDQNNGGLGYKVYTVPEGQNLIGTNFKLNPNATLGYYDGEYYYTPDDWYKEAYSNSVRQEYNVSASGSSGKIQYFASAGYLRDDGVVSNSEYQRYTGRLNADYQAKSWMKFSSNMSFTHSDSQYADYSTGYGSSGNIFYIVNNIAPIYPLYVRKLDEQGNPYIVTDNGRIRYDSNNTNQIRAWAVGNAVRDNEYDDSQQYKDAFTGKWGALLTPLKGLSFNANIGVTANNSRYRSLSSQFAGSSGSDGDVYVSHSRYFTVNQQYLAEYKFNVGLNSFDFLGGFERYKETSQGLWGDNDHLFNPYIAELDNADGTGTHVRNGSSTGSYLSQGFLFRGQYEYDGKYFVSGSYRRDSSSNFAKGHRWGDFGSFGVAWLISKESFMDNLTWLDMLKLKLSYGVQGNDSIGSNRYTDVYSHSWNENTGYSVKLSSKGNEKLTWETSKSFNVGFDFGIFNGRLNGTFEWYSRKTEDLLYSKSVPLSSGNPTGSVPVNVGSLRNRGIELTLDGSIINTRNIQWTWNANLSHYKNKILSLDESVSENGIRSGNSIIKVGGSLYDAYMFKYAGVNRETGQAQYYGEFLKDSDAFVQRPTQEQIDNELTYTKVVTSFSQASQYDLGSILPKVFGGFGTTLNAYGIDLSAQFSFQLGGKYYDGTYQGLMHTQASAGQAWHKDILKAWTPENPDTDVPRNDGDVQVSQSAVDRFLIKSDYLSINNITLGYTLPRSVTKAIKLQSVRFYIAGENLAVFSKRKGVDPRYNMGLGSMTSGAGLNSGNYSAMRNITGGITVSF